MTMSPTERRDFAADLMRETPVISGLLINGERLHGLESKRQLYYRARDTYLRLISSKGRAIQPAWRWRPCGTRS